MGDVSCSDISAVVLFVVIFPQPFNKAAYNKFPISKPFWELWCEHMKTALLLSDSLALSSKNCLLTQMDLRCKKIKARICYQLYNVYL